ncbi:MAG: dethiobiotin synthase [Kordiimonadaceae bacterium]|nr:dethiobiotin synthase [Kordiimonadaceae bacterium]
MKGLFVTATGTEVGKTFVTAALCHQLKAANKPVHAIKPIISGIEDNTFSGTDTAVIAESLGCELTPEIVNAISPFRYKAPLAPAMAAVLEGKTLEYTALLDFCRTSIAQNPFTIIEGVGGSFVPLTGNKLVANWIADLGLPSIVVAGSYLGTLSHITATLEAMAARNLPVKALVICESEGTGHPNFAATVAQAKVWTSVPVVAIPRITGICGWQKAPALLSTFF